MTPTDQALAVPDLLIRPYEPADQPVVLRLYEQGLLAGQVAPNDTGADLDHIQEAYFDDERHHFWVAEIAGDPVGMIGVSSDEDHTAEIRRLRVLPQIACHQAVAAQLLWTAIEHCKRHGYIKIRLDTHFEKDAAVGLFDRVGFQHTRTKQVHGKELLEFYLDLYRGDDNND